MENLNQAVALGLTNDREETVKREFSKLLKWFDGVDCTVKHESTRELRQRTTGEWLLKEQLYIDWRKLSAKFLWLGGKAGAGKSVLASGVIEDLLSGLADDETLAYFYCDFRNPRCISTMEVLRSLIAQLLRNSESDWLPSFSELVVRKDRGAGPPADIGTLSNLLKRAAGLYKRPMIVIDALDECNDLSKLLHELVKLCPDGHCRLFVTSRTLHPINRTFADLPSISLDDRTDAMRDDMHFHIRTELESRDRLKTLAYDLREEIQDVLMEKADGMFRWVQCHLDRLNECWSLGDVRAVLGTLPATLNETYERMLNTIVTKEFGGRVAQRALIWLVTALEPLRISQLAEAVAISCDNPDLDTTIAPMHETDILEICGSFVSFNKWSSIVTLSHYSVKEYLTSGAITNKTYFVDHPRASLELASVSIHSIILFVHQPDVDMDKHHLFHYALFSGFAHLADCVPEHNDTLLRLLITLQNQISVHRRSYENEKTFPNWMTRISQLALFIIIYFGHVSMLRHYLDRHSVQVTKEENPLVYAALYSDIFRVQMLLDKGLDVNIEATVTTIEAIYPPPKLPPLIAATYNRTPEYQEELLKLLLAQRCTVPSNAIHLVLLHRDSLCKPSMIHILLEHGADGTSLKAGGNNCLHTLLIANGFQLPPDAILQFPRGRPMECLPMLQMLIDNGAAVDVWDDYGCNALHTLLRISHHVQQEMFEAACKLLLAAGCDINQQNHAGETPIHLAVWNWTQDGAMDFLLHQGAQFPADMVSHAARDSPGRFPETLMPHLVRLVKMYGASCQELTVGANNALHCLLGSEKGSRGELMEPFLFLLENGCDFCATNSSGVTPLGAAIENGYLSIARNLLSRVAQPHADITRSDCADSQGNYLLHRLCYKFRLLHDSFDSITNNKFMERANLLQEAGYDFKRHVNTPNNQGFTPLCIVLTRLDHRHAIVSYLLDAGAKFSDVNPLFLDRFQWASGLPWYRDATEAYLARPKISFADVARVCHLLTNRCKLSLPIARLIVDMAEYWACKKVIRSNVRYTIGRGGEPIPLPALSSGTRSWTPRRVMLSCKLPVVDIYTSGYGELKLLIKRQKAMYTLPYRLCVRPASLDPAETEFVVWDNHTAAVQLNRGHQLVLEDLRSGDALSMEFWRCAGSSEELELEFFQIDMYFAMRSTDPPTPLASG
ncbi:hypothetical protein PAXINDRAFT_103259 [Paxillus involutus ATCC 200175]|uniref:Unplaced genomic scaffold PAXINscaffold_876, whole genome shotgun sequence n=1 Tax=Paxillus involutus ATCC 200175 TaxID=664439 RepID=A0A0C9SMS9_PAXIN|nr:hypothetical protein PAXINDRAFT_103259 [Paxillus involutus ATCC 200175]